MEVGCYNMDLYCDNLQTDFRGWPTDHHEHGEFPHQFAETTRERCRKAARAKGWVFRKDGVFCPKCFGKHLRKTGNG